ncbi:MAG: hypothetical protein Q4C96_02135 [Planctomycetia bacterium]|nr:hypothetical protein [Planctomycetia bacterium]
MMKKAAIFILLFCVLPIFMTGCGDKGPKRYPVSGKVTFKGAPVEKGMIVFESAEPKISPDGGEIKDGAYHCQVSPGKKIIKITGAKRVKGTGPDAELELWEDFIPEKYLQNSEITVEIKGEQTEDFHLE